jgi:hypothetical protein
MSNHDHEEQYNGPAWVFAIACVLAMAILWIEVVKA